MALVSTSIAVSTTPVLVATGNATHQDVVRVVLKNASVQCFIGGPTVTTANGVSVETTDTLNLILGPLDALWVVAAGAGTIKAMVSRQ